MLVFLYVTYTVIGRVFSGVGGAVIALVVAVSSGAVVYMTTMVAIGGLTEVELVQIPGARRLIAPLKRYKILRVKEAN